MELFQEENHKILNLFEKHKKLNFKIDDVASKLKKKITASEDKKISRTLATNGIRGLTKHKLNTLLEQGLFIEVKIDKKLFLTLP
jgi:sulfatase maturation enzyme AslB (radical SAM superfamily)